MIKAAKITKVRRVWNKSLFYQNELELWKTEHNTYMTKVEAKRLIRKLCQHYKVPVPEIKFHARRRNSGLYQDHKLIKGTGIPHHENLPVIVDGKIIKYEKIRTGFKVEPKYIPANIMRVGKNPSVGVLCHEFAHLLASQKKIKGSHSLAVYELLSQVIDYARKNHYWLKRSWSISI